MKTTVSKLRWTSIPAMLLLIGAIVSTGLAANKGSEAAITDRNVITEAEQILANLGYMVANSDGRIDPMTRHAVMAFQKVEGLKRTGVLTPAVLERLRAASTPTPKYSGPAHVEVDVTR